MKEKKSEKRGVAEKKSEKTKSVAKSVAKDEPVKKAKKAPREKKPTDKLADKSGMTIFLQHIFGDAQKRNLRRLGKRVAEINKLTDKYKKMSDKELQEQTEVLKKRLQKLQKQSAAKLALEKVKAEKEKA